MSVELEGDFSVPASKIDAEVQPGAPGEHMWTVAALWRVNPDTWRAGMKIDLDHENLQSMTSPFCQWCMRMFHPKLAAQWCSGEHRG